MPHQRVEANKSTAWRESNTRNSAAWIAILTHLMTAPLYSQVRPNLEGIWTNATLTPLERPRELSGKPMLTKEEAAAYEQRVLREANRDRRDGGAEVDVGRAYNDYWFDRGTNLVSGRTSLVVDPEDGRVPALTAEAQKRAVERDVARRLHPADGPSDRSLQERCLFWPTAGPPMLPSVYNNYYQIVQTPDHIMILVEMIHDVRIIPLDGRPHIPSNIRQWTGDSRGHWEGDTLVVDTTNFTNKTAFRGSGENLHLVERFRTVGKDTIVYEFTVDDPSTFARSWKGSVPMTRTKGPVFEYACHEGNYALEGILKGAREGEKAAGAGKH
jgi:hypothetical protein